ncbi:MAG TPA: tripartite tricarboxylate transporter TctB family protein [Usitatibacter sp.]|nr:tripartite tricarboxylate transporter TctB family protein [Usitatibacter sp.]
MPPKVKLVLPYGLMLAVSGWLYWVATRIDVDTGGRITPAAWPKAIIVFMALLCLYEIVKRLLSGTENRAQTTFLPDAEEVAEQEEKRGLAPVSRPWMLAGGIGLITLYVILVPFAGFFLSTVLFLAAFPLAGGFKRPVFAATLGIAGGFLLIVVFMRVAYISLPLGVGPFRDVSLGLMRLIGVT